ncbi:MAG: tRNA pseudouridine(55) synthase TruB, partial [Clostridiales bacterium]|nr:tRNA pseudouridine(55) synthase TruB [Clostridiales bacterium]
IWGADRIVFACGRYREKPPSYSAKHVDGKRAYELARKGETVELAPRTVTIHDIELICQPRMDETVFSITCSSGTYIRSICRDVAKMCGSLATLTYLQRVKSGCFDVKDSVSLEALELRKQAAIVSADSVLTDIPKFDVNADLYGDMVHGRKIEARFDGDARVYCNGEFFGIGCARDGVLKIKTYLRD